MFQKILIANRGEIACRIAASARRLGVQTVAVFSDADAGARHVAACDSAVHLGASAADQSYLRGAELIAAALASGAQAIHPGYGFLSENADFARACAHAGLVFIGAPVHALQTMGLKSQAKRCMAQAGVPLLPGYHGDAQEPEWLARAAADIGYPVLIKASAGGGGRGMRVVHAAADFAAALASCQREAQSSFGNDAVLLEKYLASPRHVEVQVFGDTHGQYVHLFDRDCSVQRRHQKIIEEAPAPGLPPALRAAMAESALAAARAVQYVGAGTVEFIVEQQGFEAPESLQYYFMEMNTRLQVEHPVTEAITGLDLVEWQLRVASGEPLPLAQAALQPQGHAIEVRVCAEDPSRDFLPATGTLHVLHTPMATEFACAEHGVRLDCGVRAGDRVSPFYDSLLGKLIVHGQTRSQALARMDAALAQLHIVGVRTNVQAVRQLLRSASFGAAHLDTALIAREAAALQPARTLPLPQALAAVLAHTLLSEQARLDARAAQHWIDPWARCDSWRAYGPARRSFTFTVEDTVHTAVLTHSPLQMLLDGAHYDLQFQRVDANALDLQLHAQRERVHVYVLGDQVSVFGAHGTQQLTLGAAPTRALEHRGAGTGLCAPMPGRVLSISVAVGARVRQGQVLALLDAMKMEHALCAPEDGVVSALHYAPGEQVPEGAQLLSLEPP